MSDLHYSRADYVATASQTTTVTLAGETSDAPLVADMTIVVPCANLGQYLTYTGAYTSELKDNQLTTSYPTVTLNTPGMAAAALAIDEEFRDVDVDNLTSTGNTAVDTLQGIFKNASDWVYSSPAFGGSDYPIEAVVQVENGSLTATTLAAVVGVTADSSSTVGSHPVDLFEQALAAGKISLATLKDANGIGSATFTSGDSISLYVTYTITKTRQFVVDQSVSSGSASIIVGDVTISGNDSVEEEATPITRVVRWKFTQTQS